MHSMAGLPGSISNGDSPSISSTASATSTSFSSSQNSTFSTAHPGCRPSIASGDCPPGASWTRTLSRQPSFDHGGEGCLSSTQVKQRLRAYVLNRRRRVTPMERCRRAEEKFNSSLPAPVNLHYSSTHDQFSEGGRYWHSADSATSKDEDSLIHGSDFRRDSLELPSNTDPPRLNLGPRRSSATDALLPSHRSYLGSTSEDQAILDAIEHLTGHLALKDSHTGAQLKESLLTRLHLAAGLGSTDIRKTLSEPDLLENSWPLRQLLPRLLLDKTGLENQQVYNPQLRSDQSSVLPPASSTISPRRHSLDYRTLQSTTTSIGLLSGSRSIPLEPLLEPPFVMDSSGSSGDRVDSKGAPAPGQASLRFPIGAHGTHDTPTHLATLSVKSKIKTYLDALPHSTSVRSPTQLIPNQLSISAISDSSSSYLKDSTSVRDTDEVAMDWETEVSESVHPEDKPVHPAVAVQPDMPVLTSHTCDISSPILSRWLRLPVETWSYDSCDLEKSPLADPHCRPTALAFDPDMLEHRCLCPKASDLDTHPESPERMRPVLERLLDTFLHIPSNIQLQPIDLLHMLQSAVATENPTLQQELNQLTDWNPTVLRELLSRIPLIGFCRLVRARMASERKLLTRLLKTLRQPKTGFTVLRAHQEEICTFHSKDYVVAFGNPHNPVLEPSLLLSLFNPSPAGQDTKPADAVQKLMQRLCKLNCGGIGVDSDTVWNPSSTARAARLAVGQVLCLATKVAKNEIRNGFALVRPPGHHAEPGQAMGFCYFNSVAITALRLLRSQLVSRVLILDWDIHHGNGTKLAALQHPGLLYISIHRYDGGKFFPGTGAANEGPVSPKHGDLNLTSSSEGRSQLINIAWETPSASDVNSTVLSMLDAVDRREIWRQSCERQKLYRKTSSRLIVAGLHSPETSSSSVFSNQASVLHRDPTDLPVCHCRLDANEHPHNSTVQPCSVCLSHSIRSSIASSILSGSSFLPTSSGSTALEDCRTAGSNPDRPHAADPITPHRPLLGLSDAEYLAAMRCVVIPVGHEFQPDVILISAGFDAARGHGEALGGYSVSPGLFAWITRQCMSLANSRVVLALEGGYQPVVVSECITNCLNALLLPEPARKWIPYLGDGSAAVSNPMGTAPEAFLDAFHNASDWISKLELDRAPCPEAVSNLLATIRYQAKTGWQCLQNVCSHNVAMSFSEAIDLEQRVRVLPMDAGSHTREAESHYSCASPLTNGIAQLRMDQQ